MRNRRSVSIFILLVLIFDNDSTIFFQNKVGKLDTYVVRLDKFHQAEDYHQKYWLRAQSRIVKEVSKEGSNTIPLQQIEE